MYLLIMKSFWLTKNYQATDKISSEGLNIQSQWSEVDHLVIQSSLTLVVLNVRLICIEHGHICNEIQYRKQVAIMFWIRV